MSGSFAVSGVRSSTMAFSTRSISMPDRTRSCPVVVLPRRVAMSDILQMLADARGNDNEELRGLRTGFALSVTYAECDLCALCRPHLEREHFRLTNHDKLSRRSDRSTSDRKS